jgi:glycosyltransferase involved in cell wall biosynthesis
MRILFALNTYLPEGRGGTEVHAHTIAKRLRGSHPIRVVCREGDPAKPDGAVTRSTYEGVEVVRINNTFGWAPDFEWLYKNGKVHEAFERELVAFKPDLVHIHHLTGLSTTIVETIKAGGLPLVMTLHDFWTVCPRGQRIQKDLDICENVDRNICFHCLGGIWPHLFRDRDSHRTELDSRGRLAPKPLAEFDRHLAYILGLADVLVTPSWFHRERMLDFPIDPDRIVALPHGLDPAPFRRIERKPRPVRRIGFIGSVIAIKGPHVLVDAFRHLARPDLELHVYGKGAAFHDDPNYYDRLRSRAIGVHNVHFHGAYLPSDLPRILAEIDVLVVPSLWWESFCLTIREGQLAGVPVIASDLGAMREALDGEDAGLLFRAGDARDLAEKIERLIGDEALRERLSRQQGAVKTLDEYVPELLALYRRAQAVSGQRAASLVVAPPSFPAPPSEVQVAWSLPDGGPLAISAEERRSEREVRYVLSDKATGGVLGSVTVAADGSTPVLVAPNGTAPRPTPPRVAEAPKERATEAAQGAATPEVADPSHAEEPLQPRTARLVGHQPKTRKSRRHRRERRKRQT